MHLSFSHIAWAPEHETTSLEFLKSLGLREIEVAPLRAFGDPLLATESFVREKAAWYCDRGFRVGSFQALLFGTEGLELFGKPESRERLKTTLIAIGRIAGWAGAGPMVFGSPKNRLRGELSHQAAVELAAIFFREIGDACAAAESCLVIEANPEAYGADFCTTLGQAAELVAAVDSPGFGLHLDTGGLALGNEDFEPVMRQTAGMLKHVHVSQPHLASFDDPHPVHSRVAKILHETGYNGRLAIEMRSQPDGIYSVRKAVDFVRQIYGLADAG